MGIRNALNIPANVTSFLYHELKFHDFLLIPRFLCIAYSQLLINHKFQRPACSMDTAPFFNWIPDRNYCNTSFSGARETDIFIMCTVLFPVLYFIWIFWPVTQQAVVFICMSVYILHINEGYVCAWTFIWSSNSLFCVCFDYGIIHHEEWISVCSSVCWLFVMELHCTHASLASLGCLPGWLAVWLIDLLAW